MGAHVYLILKTVALTYSNKYFHLCGVFVFSLFVLAVIVVLILRQALTLSGAGLFQNS